MSESRSVKGSRSLYTFDRKIGREENVIIIGIDEAGRGPLAGPVSAGAVILDLDNPIKGVDDSKKLSAASRDQLYDEIVSKALAWGFGLATHEEVDKVNVLQATFLAMERAVAQVNESWDLALIDGNRDHPRIEKSRQRTVIDGDALSASIAAASIIAKVTRDRIMEEYHKEYPLYGFASHKGYGTEQHRTLIQEHGLCKIHRRTFCHEILVSQTSLF